jgi:hypothetical protein
MKIALRIYPPIVFGWLMRAGAVALTDEVVCPVDWFRFLVILLFVRDLLLFAKHLFGAARTVWQGLQL